MHILHILDHSLPLHSGYTFRTLSILKEQRRLGWMTSHVTSSKQGKVQSDVEEVDGWRFYRTAPVNVTGIGAGIRDPIETVRSLRRRLDVLIDELQPTIIHAHSPVLNALAALYAARKRGLPFVYELRALWEDAAVDHGTTKEGDLRYRASRALETFALRRADAITTICEGLRTEIIGRGIDPNRVTVIPNAVDIEKFSVGRSRDEALAAKLGLGKSRVLGFMGSFYAYEGLALLLRALPSILQEAPDVRVLLVGGGPQEADLKLLAEQLGVQQHVVFVGRVPHADIAAYYDLVDVLVYPRMPMRLTELVTPLKPLEAMAQGRLLVASDVGGHRELIRDGVTGKLFKAGSAEALTQAVLGVLGDASSADAMRAAGRQFVEEERSWRRSIARYAPVYESLVSKQASSRSSI